MLALVTGSTGFVGRHMIKELESRRWKVWGLDITHAGNECMTTSIQQYKQPFDMVIHCAFNVGGRAAIDGTNMNFAKNLQLDSALFDWAVRTKQKRVLYFSSSAAYPVWLQRRRPPQQAQPAPLHENAIRFDRTDIGNPDANYGWAKLSGERLAEDARRNGLSVSVVRPFSGYGEDQSLDYPFPSIVDRAKRGDLTVWGPAGQTRDWIHIDDVVKGALAVVESGTEDPVNLCTGIGTEMGALAEFIWQVAGAPRIEGSIPQLTYLTDKPTGVFYRVGNPTRMHKYYTPQITLEEGIDRALRVR